MGAYPADHGDLVDQRGMNEKCVGGHCVYDPIIRAPLIIRCPGRIPGGRVTDDLVELVDIYPTLLDMFGLHAAAPGPLPGVSLQGLLQDGVPLGREFAISESRIQITAVTREHKLGMWVGDPGGTYPDMLFDRRVDRLEVENRIGRPELVAVEGRLRAGIESFRARFPRLH